MVFILICTYRYIAKESIVRERIVSTSDGVDNIDMPFLEFTICPTYQSAYNDNTLEKYGMEKHNYRREGKYSPTFNNEGFDLREIFNSITYNVEEIMLYMEISTLDRHHSKFEIEFEGTNTTDHIHIGTKYSDTFGRCYSIHPKDHVIKLGVTKIDIVARLDIYIYFGYPGQFMYNTKTKVIIFLNICRSTSQNIKLFNISMTRFHNSFSRHTQI